MKPGIYIGKVMDAGMTTTKAGDKIPFMTFQTESGEKITWRGNTKSEKSKDFAIKALYQAGFIGEDWEDLAVGVSKFQPLSVELTVIEDVLSDGKKITKVQWINGARSMTKVSAAEIKAKMSDRAAFAKYKTPVKQDAGF